MIINGTIGDDTLMGTNQNDSIFGGDGDDLIDAGLGTNDYVDGGTGNDILTIDYSVGDTTTAPMFVSAGSGIAYRSPGSGFIDRIDFTGIEQFIITGTAKRMSEKSELR